MLNFNKRQYESMVYIFIVLIAMLVFYQGVVKIAVATEQSRVDYDLSNIRSAMHIFELSKIIVAKQDELDAYAGLNPMKVMEHITELPVNYMGEYEHDDDLPIGSWFFNSKTGTFIYKVINKQQISAGKAYLLFKVEYVSESVKGGGAGRLKLLKQDTIDR